MLRGIIQKYRNSRCKDGPTRLVYDNVVNHPPITTKTVRIIVEKEKAILDACSLYTVLVIFSTFQLMQPENEEKKTCHNLQVSACGIY